VQSFWWPIPVATAPLLFQLVQRSRVAKKFPSPQANTIVLGRIRVFDVQPPKTGAAARDATAAPVITPAIRVEKRMRMRSPPERL
jgi:hypothetical protein